jgi:hypothetical protein
MNQLRCINCGNLFDPDHNPSEMTFGTWTDGFHCSYHPEHPVYHGSSGLGARDGYPDVYIFPCCGKKRLGGEFGGKTHLPPRSPGCKQSAHVADPDWVLSKIRPAESGFDYDIALSYAGEDRSYVEAVAHHLHALGVRVFFDAYVTAEMWGKDLYTHLDEVYRKKSRFCIMFLSRYYAEKVWTKHERASAQARALESSSEYVLPARFDDTEIPGLRPSVGYVDLRRLSPVDLVHLVLQKLDVGAEIDVMLRFLRARLPGYEITLQGTMVHFFSSREAFEADYPARLMLEMHRANEIDRMFILPAIIPN